MCPLGLGLTKAKKGCKRCEGRLLVKTRSQAHPRTRTEAEGFLYYRSLLDILESSNFLWGKKGFETIKCFEEINSTKTYSIFLFLFFPAPQTMSSVQFQMQTTINGDTHLEDIFFESLLSVENGRVSSRSQRSLHVVNYLSCSPLAVSVFKRKLPDLSSHCSTGFSCRHLLVGGG